MWHDKINSKQCRFKTSSMDHKPRRSPQTTTTPLSNFQNGWSIFFCVCVFAHTHSLSLSLLFHPVLCSPSVYASHVLNVFAFSFSLHFSPPCFVPLSVCPSTSCSPPIQGEPRFQLQLPALCGPLRTPSWWHSLQPCVQNGGTTGARSELCHCPPEQTESWGSRERGREAGE